MPMPKLPNPQPYNYPLGNPIDLSPFSSSLGAMTSGFASYGGLLYPVFTTPTAVPAVGNQILTFPVPSRPFTVGRTYQFDVVTRHSVAVDVYLGNRLIGNLPIAAAMAAQSLTYVAQPGEENAAINFRATTTASQNVLLGSYNAYPIAT